MIILACHPQLAIAPLGLDAVGGRLDDASLGSGCISRTWRSMIAGKQPSGGVCVATVCYPSTLQELVQQRANGKHEAALQQQLHRICGNRQRADLHHRARCNARRLACRYDEVYVCGSASSCAASVADVHIRNMQGHPLPVTSCVITIHD
jgi:hypothetical protein